METLSINRDQSDKLTSIINGIHGLPFKFLGFNRGNRVSIKAFPPLLKMINQALSSVISHQKYIRTEIALLNNEMFVLRKKINLPIVVKYKDTLLHCYCSQ